MKVTYDSCSSRSAVSGAAQAHARTHEADSRGSVAFIFTIKY